MLGKALIGLSAALEYLTHTRAETCGDFLVETAAKVISTQRGILLTTANHKAVVGSGKTFAITQKIESIEHIALAHAVIAQKTVDFGRKVELGLLYILEIAQIQ